MTKSAVTLLSGGLDSAVATWLAAQKYTILLAITVNYGQKAFLKELEATQSLTEWFNVPHKVIELPWLAELLPTGLRMTSGASPDEINVESDPVAHVWVPNRNGILLNLAAAYAEMLGAQAVIFGANLDEATGFPDNSQAYVAATTQALSFSTCNQVEVIAPVADMTKAQMLQIVSGSDLPLHAIWSCYESGDTPCGVCLSCQHRQQAEALAQAAT